MRYITPLTMLLLSAYLEAQKAIVIVPVADLIGQPMQALFPNTNPNTHYNAMPFAGENKNGITCPRIHQLVLHEQVDILKEQGDEVLIKVPNVFYATHDNPKKLQEFWTLKTNILPLETLQKYNVPLHNFPQPITLADNATITQPSIITLKCPFFDHSTKQHLSAGTRFVEYTQKKSPKYALVYLFNPNTRQFRIIRIPKQLCASQQKTKTKCINLFVQILKEWAHQKRPNVIPYVLGGSSFIHTYLAYSFSSTQTANKNTMYKYNNNPSTVATGFDCSELILRAAQIAGIPYFCKNTSAIAHTLTPLGQHEQLRNGDLILIPGHVIVVADTNKNTIIEARGYDQGYGKVHEISLKEQFLQINTFQDLVNAYNNKKPIMRLNKKGDIVSTIPNYKLFKLASVWER